MIRFDLHMKTSLPEALVTIDKAIQEAVSHLRNHTANAQYVADVLENGVAECYDRIGDTTK